MAMQAAKRANVSIKMLKGLFFRINLFLCDFVSWVTCASLLAC